MVEASLNRRVFLGATALSGMTLAGAGRAMADPAGGGSEEYQYEIVRAEAEWRAMLDKEEYNVLRKRSTELPKSHPLWNNTADGIYCCRGCDLTIYDSIWKVELDKGWLFFAQSRLNSVLMGIDGKPPGETTDPNAPPAMIEARCRRCGSHLGHILTVEGQTLHCINGTSLQFRPATV